MQRQLQNAPLTTAEDRRRQAGGMFAAGITPAAVARALGVSRQAAWSWQQRWLAHGDAGLIAGNPVGRPRRVTAEQLARVDAVLRDGARASGHENDTWTLGRVAEVIHTITGARYHPSHVWRLLRRMGWSREPSGGAVAQWVRRARESAVMDG